MSREAAFTLRTSVLTSIDSPWVETNGWGIGVHQLALNHYVWTTQTWIKEVCQNVIEPALFQDRYLQQHAKYLEELHIWASVNKRTLRVTVRGNLQKIINIGMLLDIHCRDNKASVFLLFRFVKTSNAQLGSNYRCVWNIVYQLQTTCLWTNHNLEIRWSQLVTKLFPNHAGPRFSSSNQSWDVMRLESRLCFITCRKPCSCFTLKMVPDDTGCVFDMLSCCRIDLGPFRCFPRNDW